MTAINAKRVTEDRSWSKGFRAGLSVGLIIAAFVALWALGWRF